MNVKCLHEAASIQLAQWGWTALWVLAMMAAMPAAGHAAISVLNLRCESKASPLGIDVSAPRLSWQIQSDQRATMQSAYQVRVASSAALLKSGQSDMWDSGKVSGDQSINVEYTGKPLASGMQCFWNVTVWDQNGSQASSVISVWEMGLLTPQDWTAKWIDAPQSQPPLPATAPATRPTTKPAKIRYPPNVPPYLRKEFMIGGEIKRARLYATALGLYAFWINGQRVGDYVLTPDWTDYRKRVRYQTYDVTELLQRGTNAAGAILGDGWYAGHVAVLPGHVYGERPALLAQIVIDFADGTRQVIGTDTSWKTALGPLLKSDLLDGEEYDAQREFSGWTEPGFDDFAWQSAGERSEHPSLEAQIAPPVRKTHELPVKAMTEPMPGRLTFDLGQNMVGFVRLKVSGEKGTRLTLRFAEMLNPDGTIYTENLRGAKATDTYILKGGGEETWEPTFTFHGFRYVELTGFPAVSVAEQHRLGTTRKFRVGADGLSAARRAAGVDGGRGSLYPHRDVQL
jgi:alpha-L-rhamnosidase